MGLPASPSRSLAGQVDKIVLTQKSQMRAVIVTIDRSSQLDRDAAWQRASGVGSGTPTSHTPARGWGLATLIFL